MFNEGRTIWTDHFSVEEEIEKGARHYPEAILFVDIGGDIRHERLAPKKKISELARPLRESRSTSDRVSSEDDIEPMAHVFLIS